MTLAWRVVAHHSLGNEQMLGNLAVAQQTLLIVVLAQTQYWAEWGAPGFGTPTRNVVEEQVEHATNGTYVGFGDFLDVLRSKPRQHILLVVDVRIMAILDLFLDPLACPLVCVLYATNSKLLST